MYDVPRSESAQAVSRRNGVIRQEFRTVKALCEENPYTYEVGCRVVETTETGGSDSQKQSRIQSLVTPAQSGDESTEPTLLFAPAQRGPWGVVMRLGGPSLPFDGTSHHTAALRRADGLLRHAMVLLDRRADLPDQWIRASRLFQQALEILGQSVGDLHPLVAYAYDRLGFVHQELGDVREAERLYLRAIAIRDTGGWVPTKWDELTFINLAILYGQQGRHTLRDAMVHRSRSAATWVGEG
jgi:tetratricopeptide (TPR) repeat protein